MSDFPQVRSARYLGKYSVWLEFRDGTSGEIDLEPELYGEMFEPLRDPQYFARFTVNEDLHTLVWPNGADFAPEFLHELSSRERAKTN